jgi:hypothetical protein
VVYFALEALSGIARDVGVRPDSGAFASNQLDAEWTVSRNSCICEAITAVETAKEKWCDAVVNRVAEEMALKSSEHAYFERALAVAPTRSKSQGLRPAMSMARLWLDQGKRPRPEFAPLHSRGHPSSFGAVECAGRRRRGRVVDASRAGAPSDHISLATLNGNGLRRQRLQRAGQSERRSNQDRDSACGSGCIAIASSAGGARIAIAPARAAR